MKSLGRLMFFVLLLSFVSCDNSVFYNDHASVDILGWPIEEPVDFDVDVEDGDTTTCFDFYVDMRVCKDYAYSNAFLFIGTYFPDGSFAIDTLECPLALPDGRWRGKETGRYVDSRFLLKKNASFPMSGTYKFRMTQGMRDESIAGIKDVGLHIVRSVE